MMLSLCLIMLPLNYLISALILHLHPEEAVENKLDVWMFL